MTRPTEYTSSELKACLELADALLGRRELLPSGLASRLEAWRREMHAERDLRLEIAAESRRRSRGEAT